MDRSIGVFVLAVVAAWLAGLLLSAGPTDPVIQPIDFNHKAHAKRVKCRECHFICEHNRDEDGEIDCEDCLEADTAFCEKHVVCPDHRLPGLPQTRDCLRCHQDDLIDLKDTPADEGEPSDRRKRVLLEYVTFDESDEPVDVRPIPWKRVTRLPGSNIYFSHRTHTLVKKIACKVCHGEATEWEHPPPAPTVELSMNACLDCHHAESATDNCVSCHR
jgi:hypothetical protein